MTIVRLSSKGQLVLPKDVRDRISATTGTLLEVEVREGLVVLRPMAPSALSMVHGKYRDTPLLEALEAEHQEELTRD